MLYLQPLYFPNLDTFVWYFFRVYIYFSDSDFVGWAGRKTGLHAKSLEKCEHDFQLD